MGDMPGKSPFSRSARGRDEVHVRQNSKKVANFGVAKRVSNAPGSSCTSCPFPPKKFANRGCVSSSDMEKCAKCCASAAKQEESSFQQLKDRNSLLASRCSRAKLLLLSSARRLCSGSYRNDALLTPSQFPCLRTAHRSAGKSGQRFWWSLHTPSKRACPGVIPMHVFKTFPLTRRSDFWRSATNTFSLSISSSPTRRVGTFISLTAFSPTILTSSLLARASLAIALKCPMATAGMYANDSTYGAQSEASSAFRIPDFT